MSRIVRVVRFNDYENYRTRVLVKGPGISLLDATIAIKQEERHVGDRFVYIGDMIDLEWSETELIWKKMGYDEAKRIFNKLLL